MRVNQAASAPIATPKFGRRANADEIEAIRYQAQDLFGQDAIPVQTDRTHVHTRKRIFGEFRDKFRSMIMGVKMGTQCGLDGETRSYTEVAKFHSRNAADAFMSKQERKAIKKGLLISGSANNGVIRGGYSKPKHGAYFNVGRMDDKTVLTQVQIQPGTNRF